MQDTPTSSGPTRAAGLGTRAAGNTLLVLAARVVSRLVTLVAVIEIGRHLGDAGFGRFQTLVTYTALVATLVDLGFNTLYVREGARHLDQLGRYLDSMLSVKVLLSLAALLALFGVLHVPGLSDLLWPGFAMMVLSTYSNLLRNTFYATGQLVWEALDIVLESVVLLGLVVVGALTHQGVAFYAWAYAASYGASCVWFLVLTIALGIARPRWDFDTALLRSWLRAGLPLGVTFVLTNVYFKLDVPMLQRFRPYSEVGWYTLAYKPFESLLFIPITVRSVVFPVLSVYFRDSRAQMELALDKLYKALLIVGWPCTVGLLVLAGPVNHALALYPESEAALRILACAIVFMFVDNTFIAALNAMDRQGTYALIALAGLVFNFLLNLVVIPRWGYLGSSSSTVITEILLASLGFLVLWRRGGHRLPLLSLSARTILAGTLMGLALLPFSATHSRTLACVAVVVGMAVYAALLRVLRVLDADERTIGRTVLGRGAARLRR